MYAVIIYNFISFARSYIAVLYCIKLLVAVNSEVYMLRCFLLTKHVQRVVFVQIHR